MLHIEEGEAEDEIVGVIFDLICADITFFIILFNALLLPFSRLIPKVSVYPKRIHSACVVCAMA